MTVRFTMPAEYVPGEPKAIVAALDYGGSEPVTALALRVVAPEGWQYAGVSGVLRPAIEPPAGARGELTFVWIEVPNFPATFECMLDTPEHATGPAKVTTQAVYRGLGGELSSPEVLAELSSAHE